MKSPVPQGSAYIMGDAPWDECDTLVEETHTKKPFANGMGYACNLHCLHAASVLSKEVPKENGIFQTIATNRQCRHDPFLCR